MNGALRILHVLPALSNGGAERLVVSLANRADEAGHAVTLLTCHRSAHEDFARDLRPGIARRSMTELTLPVLGVRGRVARAALHAIGPWWTRARPSLLLAQDVVHAHLPLGARIASAAHRARGRGARPAIVESFHADWECVPLAHRRFFEREWARREALILESPRAPAPSDVAALHPGVLARFIPVGAERPRVESVTPAERGAWMARAGLPPGEIVTIVTVSRMQAERQSERVVPAMAAIARRLGRRVHLAWIGDGPLRPLVERQARELGVEEQVHLLGFDADVRVPLSLARLALTGVNGEDCGVAGFEAMLAGVPVIALQWLDGQPEDGWIPSARDPERFAGIVAGLLASPDRLRALHAAQAERARARHSMEATWAATERLYRDAVARRMASAPA